MPYHIPYINVILSQNLNFLFTSFNGYTIMQLPNFIQIHQELVREKS